MATRTLITVLLLAGLALAADPPKPVCGEGEFAAVSGCTPSPSDIHEARHAFKQGLKFEQQGKLEQALSNYSRALRLQPNSPQARQNLGEAHIQAAMQQLDALRSDGSAHEEADGLSKTLKDAASQANP